MDITKEQASEALSPLLAKAKEGLVRATADVIEDGYLDIAQLEKLTNIVIKLESSLNGDSSNGVLNSLLKGIANDC